MKDLTVKALQKAVDFIINSNEDHCQICAYLRPWTEEEMNLLDDGLHPCFYYRTNGATACRNGIIEHLQKDGE